jgi:excisionase family DNA binding protein
MTALKDPDPNRLTMTIPEAARKLGIGKNEAYAAAKRGEFPTIKIGCRVLVPRAALERLMRGEISQPNAEG